MKNLKIKLLTLGVLAKANTPHQFIVKSCKYSPCYIMGIFADLKEDI
jgi:hypothetical protein